MSIAMSASEYEQIREAALLTGSPHTAWAREKLLEVAYLELHPTKRKLRTTGPRTTGGGAR